MNDNFKNQLAAFARDMKAMCDEHLDTCEHCPMVDMNDGYCKAGFLNSKFNPETAISAVEAYRKRKKPCAEVIDRAVDIYTIEVEIERDRSACSNRSVDRCAKHLKQGVWQYFGRNSDATVRVISAKRFVLGSHREDAE